MASRSCISRLIRGLNYISHFITSFMENFYYRFGVLVGQYPLVFVATSVLVCAALGSGFVYFHEEKDDIELWTTVDSEIRDNSAWISKHFQGGIKFETALITADNVLTPTVLQMMLELDEDIKMINASGEDWPSVCARYGNFLKNSGEREKRSSHGRQRYRRDENSAPQTPVGNEGTSLAPRTPLDGVGFLSTPRTVGDSGGLSLMVDQQSIAAEDPHQLETTTASSETYTGVITIGGPLDNDWGDWDITTNDSDDYHVDYYDLLGLEPNSLDTPVSPGEDCLFKSLLEIWSPDLKKVAELSQQQMLEDINAALAGGSSVGQLLSGIERDSNGQIVSANATLMVWMIRDQSVDNNHGNKIDPVSDEWELEFLNQIVGRDRAWAEDINVYGFTSTSFNLALDEAVVSNLIILFSGFCLILVYVAFMLGRWNCVEQRVYLSIMGVLVVGMAIVSSYGLCAYAGVIYGPIHGITPFLLLGIGIDDMFVIIQTLENLSVEEKLLPVPQKIGKALQHAGVSITITSVTDIVAFGVGASTAMPSINSFCTYATLGIVFVFLYELTFFVGCTVLDEKRIAAKRDGCFFRRAVDKWTPNQCSHGDYYKRFFHEYFGPFITWLPMKIFVVVVTLALVGVNVWAIFQLEQNFDPNGYLSTQSHAALYTKALEKYFPENGERSEAFVGDVNYLSEREELNRFYVALRSDPLIKHESVDFWFASFQDWFSIENNGSRDAWPSSRWDFNSELSYFLLMTPTGQKYVRDIAFTGDLLDDFNITASRITFRHVHMNHTYTKNHAMDLLKNMAANITFTTGKSPHPIFYSYNYMQWEANKLISEELAGNLSLTVFVVLMVTLVMISNIQACFWVSTCVCFTLIDVAGMMYFFNLTIEVVTSIILILSIGLAVDYSAHIAHTFTTLRGTKDERACETLARMGPPVFNGGLSTFMAFVLLSNSDSYVFLTFFKVFGLVVLFGLFHGLMYLPIMLSLFGPPSPPGEEQEKNKKKLSVYTIPITDGLHAVYTGDKMVIGSFETNFPKFVFEDYSPSLHRRHVVDGSVKPAGSDDGNSVESDDSGRRDDSPTISMKFSSEKKPNDDDSDSSSSQLGSIESGYMSSNRAT